MRLPAIAKSLGGLLFFLAAAGIFPLLADLFGSAHAPAWPWLVMIALAAACGGLLWWWGGRYDEQLGLREGIAITGLLWLVASLIAGVGVWLASPATFIEAWFECMSGFTTTGSTIFGGEIGDPYRIGDLSPGVKLWRSIMQWLGGLGIVVISLALLPLLVSGSGFHVYRAEMPGLDTTRLAPRIRDTARILLRLYIGLTMAMTLGLLACGVGGFDAICHAMTTVATGGYSTYDDSIEGLRSVAAEWVIIVGMFACGINFAILLQVLRGKAIRFWASEETRLYCGLCLIAIIVVITCLASGSDAYDGRPHDLIRDGIFQVVAIITSTGYATGYDTVPLAWEGWPPPCIFVIVLLMLGGGCAGSTSGGIKLIRFLIAIKAARRELRRFMEPARITPVSIEGRTVSDQVVLRVGTFLFLYFLTWAIGALLLAMLGHDLTTALSASLSAVSNIGPALGEVGASEHYRPLGASGQVVCIFLMLFGRLEFLGVLMLLRPRHWTR